MVCFVVYKLYPNKKIDQKKYILNNDNSNNNKELRRIALSMPGLGCVCVALKQTSEGGSVLQIG